MITITNRKTFIFTFIAFSLFLYSQKYEQVETFEATINDYKISSYLKIYDGNIDVKICVNNHCRHFDKTSEFITMSHKETFEKAFQINLNITHEFFEKIYSRNHLFQLNIIDFSIFSYIWGTILVFIFIFF